MNRNLYEALLLGAVAVLFAACSTGSVAYPPPTNPFLSGAPPVEQLKITPATKAVLVWLEPTGTVAPPERAQRALAEKIKSQFSAGKRLEIVGTVTIPAPLTDPLTAIRRASAPFNVEHTLVVMPNMATVDRPAELHYGRDGRAVGTITDSYSSVALVAVDLRTGDRLFSVLADGDATLFKADYEDARPFFPRISPGAHSSAFIYPDGRDFAPGEVHAVALEQAVNGLIYKLDRALEAKVR